MRDADDVPIEVTGAYSPGSPGRTWGDPYDCYPEDPPEVEILEVLTPDGQPWTGELTPAEHQEICAELEAAAVQNLEDRWADAHDPDAAWDGRYDR